MHHYRKTVKKYHARQNVSECPFCDRATLKKAIRTTSSAYVVPNLTYYDIWEGHDVEDHLLVIPKRHVKSMKELTETERLEIIDLVAEYEAHNYSMYARGVGSVTRSVEHQHTHLIKMSPKRPRFAMFLRRPYFLLKI